MPKNFLQKFRDIITGDDYNKGKPFPDPYIKAIKMSKLNKKNCLVYENAPLGIISAQKAEIKTVAVTNTLDKKYFLNADYIVNSATEFKKLITKINK